MALLWLAYAILLIIDAVLVADSWVSSVIFQSGTPVFAGMLAGWALRLRAGTLGLIALLCSLAIGVECLRLAWIFVAALLSSTPYSVIMPAWWTFTAAAIATIGAAIWRLYASRGKAQRIVAIALAILANVAAISFTQTDDLFWNASRKTHYMLYASVPEAEAAEAEEPDPMAGIPLDRLWEAQGDLVAKEAEALRPPVTGQANIYAVAVAAGGGQQLFAREAQLALKVAGERFGGRYRGGMLLSNGVADLLHHPLASRTNFVAAARSVAAHSAAGPDDITLVYLAAHGSDEAFLGTDLPNYQELTPISAASVAKALGQAGIKRRIIIVSACFSASWIPALANDDTIVIAAAARDRTSFGCDDRRDVTYFGEAFLKGSLARGASLHDAFEEARRKIAVWEKKEELEPSKPEAFVGKNMQAVWTAREKQS